MHPSHFKHHIENRLFFRRGHPTRDTDNKCYIDSTTAGADLFCKAGGTPQCPGGCRTCDTDDVCSKIHETECTMEDPGTDHSSSAPTEEGCSLFCTQLGLNGEASFVTFEQRVSTAEEKNTTGQISEANAHFHFLDKFSFFGIHHKQFCHKAIFIIRRLHFIIRC